MTEPNPQRDRDRRDEDRPIMGDRPELETEDPYRPEMEPEPAGNPMMRWLVPAIIVVVIVVIVIALFTMM